MDVAVVLGVFIFIYGILPQEQLQVIIDNSIDTIDFLDGRALHKQMMRLRAPAICCAGPKHIGVTNPAPNVRPLLFPLLPLGPDGLQGRERLAFFPALEHLLD
jgi:hypothetical protein